jgi:hypothetical protein
VGVPVLAGFQEHTAAGGDRLRVGHADRDQVVEALKDAFVQGQLTRDELDMRVSQALAARTGAELAALTADIPVGPTPPVLARAFTGRRPLARAAAVSSPCLAIASAALWVVGHLDHPLGSGPYRSWVPLCLLVAIATMVAALFILGYGVGAAIEQRRSRGARPALPGDPGLGFMP